MPFMPFCILGVWVRGLVAVVILALGIGLLGQWSRERTWVEAVPAERGSAAVTTGTSPARPADVADRPVEARVHHWRFGLNWPTVHLLGGLTLLAIALGGARVFLLFRPSGTDEPRDEHTGESRRLARPDGSELHVEFYGPEGAPTLVLTHGWGANGGEWFYLKKELADRFRLIVWDLPGLGRSTRPRDNDWSLERLAGHLDAVVSLAGDRPVVLLGHSIGGMIILTYCRLFPEALASRIAGLVLVHTTYTNPVKTTSLAPLYTALQKPVLEPLCHLMIGLSPLVWLMNWLTYLNGSVHRSVHNEVFAGHETRGQLKFVAQFQPKAWPAVVARGMLGMLRYDASATLPTIGIPTLVVEGDRDITTKPEASRHIAQHVPGARLTTLAPGRHMGLIEHHRQFAEAVDEFVTAHAASAPATASA